MIKINPREVAAKTLGEIASGAYNGIALSRTLRQNGAMPEYDKAFVTETVNGSLRNIIYIDYIINKFSTLPANKIKPYILSVLRISVYQIMFMDKVPVSAVCNEAVKLVKSKNMGALSGFVNGVLRSVVNGYKDVLLPDESAEPLDFLSVKYSCPKWLVNMWLSYYGYEFTKEMLMKNNTPPKVTIRVNTLKTDTFSLCEELSSEGVRAEKSKNLSDSLYISNTSDISRLKSFKEGLFHVQDEASQLVSWILNPKEGEKILDVCAAPGGKSFTIAELMKDKGSIVSRDIYENKVYMISEGAKRLGLLSVKAEESDAVNFNESDFEKYDKVLVDAPCSGLGLIRKKPDIRLKKDGNYIDSLIDLQRKILTASEKCVKPGGILVYSTCTLSKKENTGNMDWFCGKFNFCGIDITSLLPDNINSETAPCGYIELYPHINDMDGFFISCMRKKEYKNG
ncbi:MAG: 16S rRNA (cytosine(967)-C(5))-methyltransferase RsmB [Lachnospiraceae bacterium]|nr:16S rRNA (cytosine(967)-C(5))-methyltransferase RsmB [Lachnospiraceae bacterium]